MQTINNLYILGTSSLGITKVPVRITNETELYSYFGTTGSLIEAYRKLSDVTNYPNVHLVKINGTHSNIDINIKSNKEILHKGISITSVYSCDNNDIRIILTDEFMQIINNNYIIEYNFSLYNTVHSLIQKINQDAEKLICPVKITNNTLEEYAHPSTAIVSCNPPLLELSDSISGEYNSKLQNYFDISQTLEILKGNEIDHIIFADCYIDDCVEANYYGKIYNGQSRIYQDILGEYVFFDDEAEKFNYYDLMLNFCVSQYKYNILTKGVIGFKPMKTEYDISYYEDICKSIKDIHYKYNIKSEYLSFVSVTCGDIYYDNGGVIDNHYIAYAGVLSSEGYNVNINNIDYGDNISLRYFLDNDKAKLFSSMKFVTVRHSHLTDKCHIVNGVTMSDDLLSNEYVFRVLQYTNKIKASYLDEFLGESITKSLLKSINIKIKEMFNTISENTCITNCTYIINNTNEEINIECEMFFPGYINPIKIII